MGLRQTGVDARLIDIPAANKVYPQGYPQKWDRKAPIASMDWAINADVIVNHSGYDGTPVDETEQPVIHVAHGRPRSGFLTEDHGGTPIMTYQHNKNHDPRWRAVVTFWPEHVPHLELLLPDKPVRYVQPCVDLDYWSPGDTDYDFHGAGGDINLVCTDPRRDDNDAQHPLTAASVWNKGKIHLYGTGSLKAFKPLVNRLNERNRMGCVVEWSPDLRQVYRAADILVTSSGIHTRSVREAMACGCPVVQVGADVREVAVDFEHAMSVTRQSVRNRALSDFDPRKTALEFKRVIDECIPTLATSRPAKQSTSRSIRLTQMTQRQA